MDEHLTGAAMAHPIQIILTRQLAGYLSTVRYLGIEVDDALAISEQVEL